MPLQSPKRKVTDAENKLRVLMCLAELGMATAEQLWPFVARLELMEYLPFCVFVDELKKDGAIAVGSHALEGVMYLTEQGEHTLRLFGGRVVPADRERIRAAAPAYAASLSERRQAQAAYERAPRGEYRVACTVREGDVPALFLRLATRDAALARKAAAGFRACAPRLLTLLYTLPFPAGRTRALPLAAAQGDALAMAAEGEPALCAYGGPERAACVRLRGREAVYTALLLLPDEAAAQSWAQAALSREGGLADEITALLAGGEA